MQIDDASLKIARLSTEAARNYADAAFAAYANFASQSMTMWAKALDSLVPKPEPEPRSWYRPPARESAPPAASFGFGFAAFGWPAQPTASTRASLPATMPTPLEAWQAWMRMWPMQGSPASWPMAFLLMQAGWPREVAYPTAMGNVAMMQAVGTAAEIANQTFSSYQSDGGHASAHVRMVPARR